MDFVKILKSFEAFASYTFIDPDTNHKYSAPDKQTLIAHIVRYRVQNQLDEIPHLPQVIDNYLCTLPENIGKCETSPKLERSFYQYIKGGVALLQSYLFSSYVNQEEANRRSTICNTCPLNIFPDKGAFLEWADDIAGRSIGTRRSLFHNNLANCKACSCLLRSKVWYGGTIELTPEQEKEIKSVTPNCWQLKGK